MPRLNCTFREFIDILERRGFVEVRQASGSHRRYRGAIDGKVRMVTVAFHGINEDIRPATLESMIRQSGLPKSLFRK